MARSRRLVGRSAELAVARTALDDAASGRGSTVLVGGEAGIGKTRLVAELAEGAREAGVLVLPGRCIELVGPGVPYFAVLEALGSVGAAPGGPYDAVDRADGPVRLYEAVRATLDELAARAPVVFVVEDLHWADASTLGFVAYLARVIGHRRILLVGTYRSDEVRPDHPLARLAVELVRARDARAVELPPLGPDDLRALLEGVAGSPLPDELTSAITARSGGNPFFAEELLAAAGRGADGLPDLLREALRQRVARVDPAGQDALRVAAAFGRDVPYRLLATLAPGPGLDTALRQAVEHGVLVPDQAAGTYRFRHALLAEAVYATLLPGERERLHAQLAVLLSDSPDGGPEVAGELARHWSEAGCPTEALAASVHAARAAEAVCGLSEALRHVERALDLWPQVPAAEKLAGADLPAVLAWAAELADLTGRSPRAAALARQAISLIDEQAEGVRAGLLHERLGSYLLPIGDRAAALAACRRATELVPAHPPTVERAQVLTSLGNALMLSWRHAESAVVCQEALATAEAVGDPRPALRAANVLGVDHCYLGRPEQAQAQLHAARRQALAHGTPRDAAHSHAVLCETLIATGRSADAVRVAEEGLTLARRWGVERSFGALLAAYAAEACLDTGDWDRAEELLAEAYRTGTAFWAHYPRLLHAQLSIARGDHAGGREHLAAGALGERQPTSAGRYAQVAAELALWEGRPDAAVAAVEAGLAAHPHGGLPRVRLAAWGLRALADRVGVAIGRDGAAGDEAAVLLRLATSAAAEAAAVTPEAGAWLAQAEAEHARVLAYPRPDLWRAAVAAWDGLGRPYPAAYCRWRLADAMLTGPGGGAAPGEPARTARSAYQVACRLGAAPLRRELELLAERGRLDLAGPPAPERPDAIDALHLTAREREVLRLLGRGYTNREIAAELVISVKTASVHVSHILRKLDVPRRLDAAGIAHRLGASTRR